MIFAFFRLNIVVKAKLCTITGISKHILIEELSSYKHIVVGKSLRTQKNTIANDPRRGKVFEILVKNSTIH